MIPTGFKSHHIIRCVAFPYKKSAKEAEAVGVENDGERERESWGSVPLNNKRKATKWKEETRLTSSKSEYVKLRLRIFFFHFLIFHSSKSI